jgi:hypothetical protein
LPGLLDILPPTAARETIEIRNSSLDIRGLDALELAALMRRYPEILAAASGKAPSPDAAVRGMEAAVAVIACALDKAGDTDTETEIASRLSLPERQMVFNRVMALTMPEGTAGRPFEPAAAGDDAASATGQATNRPGSPSPS